MKTALIIITLLTAGVIMLVKWAWDSEAKKSVGKQDSVLDPMEDYYNDLKMH
jgi:hypothetical protein